MPIAGTTMGYRPKPANFRELFIEHGWSSIEAVCRAHKKTILRWIEEEGRDELIAARRQRTGYGLRRSAGRYVIGRTLRPIGQAVTAVEHPNEEA